MSDRLEIIAHRGSSWEAPENTLAAVELAWQERADAVEADFRLTRDGRLVAIHDDSTFRTAGLDLRVAEQTLDELRKLDVGRWKAPRFADQRIATLGELLATMPAGKRFYVEIKCGPEISAPLAATVRDCEGSPEQIVLICFSASVLVEVRRALPRCPTYLVGEFLRDPHTGAWHPDADALLAEAVRSGLVGLDLMAARALDPELVARIRSAGLDLCVWTVDQPDEARQLLNLGIRRITTNRPGWLREQLAAGSKGASGE
jgi:glycerophosphoryl diester phosphodiesterase